MNAEKIQGWVDKAIEVGVEWSPKLLGAIVGLIIGLILIRMITNLALGTMKRARIDETLRPFLANLLGWTLKAALGVAVLTTVGIQATSFVAILGAAGLAVGLSLQGSLSNFAGGVLILIFRPFKVGDLIEAAGATGVVKEIQIFATILTTPDNKRVIIPNAAASNTNITNYSAEPHRRVDLVIGIDYSADIKKAREVLLQVMKDHKVVLNEPAPSVNVASLGDNSVNLAVRPFVKPEDYWTAYFEVQELGKMALDEAGIGIPFPQRVIHYAKDQ